MKFEAELTDEPPSDWNNYLLKIKTGTIYNTVEYAKYAPLEGFQPKFFRLTDSRGNVVLQALLLEYINQTPKVRKLVGKIIKKFNILLRWNYGPVTDSSDSLKSFFEYLKNTKMKIYGITHPFLKLNDIEFSKRRWGTFLINLQKSKDELYNNIEKHSGRKNIERAVERNLTVEEITDNSILEYLELFNQTKATRNGIPTTIEQMKEFWRLLKPAGLSGFLARKNGITVGGLLFSHFNKYINEWGVARSNQDYKEKLYSQDLIKWKIIKWGVDKKMNWYDLSGFNPHPISKKEEGIMKYKKKWGGKEYYQWIIKS